MSQRQSSWETKTYSLTPEFKQNKSCQINIVYARSWRDISQSRSKESQISVSECRVAKPSSQASAPQKPAGLLRIFATCCCSELLTKLNDNGVSISAFVKL